jgi:hypothetical protein
MKDKPQPYGKTVKPEPCEEKGPVPQKDKTAGGNPQPYEKI